MSKTNIEKNLEALLKSNPGLTKKIIDHSQISGKFEFKEAKSGDVIISINDYILHDQINPQREASKVFNSIKEKNKPDNVFIIFGLGLGYLFKRFTLDCKGKIIVFEPSMDVLRITLESVDFSQELNSPNISIANTVEELNSILGPMYKNGSEIEIVTIDSYQRLYSDIIEKFKTEIKNLMPEPYKGGPLKLNIGPGRWKKEGWKTLDCYVNANFNTDLRKMENFPLENNVIEKAFSSHCIEHIEDEHCEHLFKELYRCMQPGGIVRLSCPDSDQALEAYKRGDKKWFLWVPQSHMGEMLVNVFSSYEHGGPKVAEETVKEKFETLEKGEFIKWCNSLIDRTRPYIAHTNGHYYEKLEKMLSKAGFTGIRKSAFKQSWDHELRGDEFDLHPQISLFVECYKPV